MNDSQPLHNETILFTGTVKSTEPFELVKRLGGEPISLPLIETAEYLAETDELRMQACITYDWLIFTSQSAVQAFADKMARFHLTADDVQTNIAAIGTKTAAALEQLGLTVQFIPTVFSADVFVKQFKPVENDIRRLLFIRGSMAGATIKEELPFEVDEWTVYTTEPVTKNCEELIRQIQQQPVVSVLFASPSAVRVFAQTVAPVVGWQGYTIGAIGHITEQALLEQGATVAVTPVRYTMVDLVEKLANRKEVL